MHLPLTQLTMEIATISIPNWLIAVVLTVVSYVVYMTWHFRVFRKMGVKGPTPIPIFGNLLSIRKLGFAKTYESQMKKYGNVWGIFEGRKPSLCIVDDEMLKELMVKKFSLFTNRSTEEGINLQKALTVLKDEHWKSVRSHMTPSFSGGKMKRMTAQIQNASNLLTEQFEKECIQNKELDVKRMFSAYTMDVISSTAFGIQANCQQDPDDPFIQNVTKLFDLKTTKPILLISLVAPFLVKPLNKIFGVSFISKEAETFFRKVIIDAINKRDTGRQDYVDFIQLMMQAHKDNPGSTKGILTFDEIIANSLLFLFAGYETTASALTFLSYNLALHPDIQSRVVEEIERELGDDVPDYDNIQKLKYLDMCMNESLRVYPPSARTNRVCAEETEIKGIKIPKGMAVTIPIWVVHHCEEYWPDSYKFDPERFSDKKKDKVSSFHFLPFGYGPRNCIGMRLAILKFKLAFVGIIRKFKFSVGEKTQIPPKLNNVLICPDNLWLKVEKRVQQSDRDGT